MKSKFMNIIILVFAIIIILIIIGYMFYFTKNSPSIIGENYDKNQSQIIENKYKSLKAEYSFDINNCHQMNIISYENNIIKKEKIITSKEIITEITNLLKTLPKQGLVFISFIPVTQEDIYFFCENEKTYKITYHNNSLKTPGTTFYGEKMDAEEKIHNIIMDLLK